MNKDKWIELAILLVIEQIAVWFSFELNNTKTETQFANPSPAVCVAADTIINYGTIIIIDD